MSMREISLPQWLYLFATFQSWRRPLAQSRHLAPFVDEFDELHAAGTAALARSSGPTTAEALRAACRDADAEHDDRHRLAYNLIRVFAEHGPHAERARVRRALDRLYPQGLRVISASWAEEVGATPGFAERLAEPAVRDDLAPVVAEIPALFAHLDACVTAGNALGQALAALDASGSGEREATIARMEGECREVWQLFERALERSARRDAALAELRDQARRLYQRQRKAAASGQAAAVVGDAPADAPAVEEPADAPAAPAGG